MHLCIHCHHHALTPGGDHLCRHPEIAEPSPVTGEPTAHQCGPEGAFFDPLPGHEETDLC